MTDRAPFQWTVAIALAIAAGGCSSHPEGFQAACTRAGTALFALDRGDKEGAREALDSAYALVELAAEDTAGAGVAEERALDKFSTAIAAAYADFGSPRGRAYLVEAKAACG